MNEVKKKQENKNMSEIQTSLKCILCELLKDMEVQKEIKDIVREEKEEAFQQKLQELEKEKELLHHQLEEARIECERLQGNYRKLENEKTTLEKEKVALEKENVALEKENAELGKENAELEKENAEIQNSKNDIYRQFQSHKKEFEPLEDINEIWKGIQKLDKSQKLYLKNLCGSWDIKSFIALGKDKNGIKQLWNFIKDEIMNSNRKTEHIRILAKYFDLCVGVFNITNIRKERYEKIEVLIGKEFDSRRYIKTSESIVNGVVQDVLLNGYYMQEDVMKPVVIVR